MRRLLQDMVAALMLLTRLPVQRFAGPEAADPAAAVWAYPLVGLLVGGVGALADWAARASGMTPLMAAVWSVAAMIAATGALHEDGLADTADGLGARGDKSRTLAIMRDSRIGTFGALALLLVVGARVAAIAGIAHPAAALLAAGASGRAAMLVLLVALSPARNDGLGAGLRKRRWLDVAIGLAIAAVADWLLLAKPFLLYAATLATTGGLAYIARRRIGGYTGDVLGAGEQIGEVVALTCVTAVLF